MAEEQDDLAPKLSKSRSFLARVVAAVEADKEIAQKFKGHLDGKRGQSGRKAAATPLTSGEEAFDDDDVLSSSSGDEDMDSADEDQEITDDSEDLLAAAQDGEQLDSSDLGEQEEGEEEDTGEGEDADADEPINEDGRQPAGERVAKRASMLKPDEEHDMLLMAQTTSDGTAVQLQVAELLKEVRASLSPAVSSQLDEDLSRLRKVLTAISPHQVSGSQAAGFIRDLGLSPAAVSLQFQPPTVVAAVGSLPLGAAMVVLGSTPSSVLPVTLDVALLMPSSCCFKKAHLNYRYHAMRALYLATIWNHLCACPAFATRNMHLEALQEDPSRPVLVVAGPAVNSNGTVGATTTPSYQLRLIPCCSPSLFPLQRLLPDRNGVRWVCKRSASAGQHSNQAQQNGVADKPPQQPAANGAMPQAARARASSPAAATQQSGHSDALLAATPTYNMGIISDLMVLPHSALLQRAAHSIPAFADGCLLLKVWAAQHGLACWGAAGSADGLDGHTLIMLLAHLASEGKLTASMSPLQILRCALQALAGSSHTTASANFVKGISMTPVTLDALNEAINSAAAGMLNPSFSTHGSRTGQVSHKAHDQQEALIAGALGLDTVIPADSEKGQDNEASVAKSPFAKHLAGPSQAPVYKKSHPVMLLDPLGLCNCASHMSKAALSAVTTAAQASLSLLNTPADAEAALASVLLSPTRHGTCFDYLWAIDVPAHSTIFAATGSSPPAQPATTPTVAAAQPVAKNVGGKHASRHGAEVEEEGGEAASHWAHSSVGDMCAWREQELAVESTIKTALTDRAHLVRAIRRGVPPTPVTALQAGLLRVTQPHEVLVGARVDASLATRVVDIGPPADDLKAAARFRAFWGDHAELRRFQDGKISEAVVWGGPNTGPGSRHVIPDQIVGYVLKRHRPGGALGTMRSSAGALDVVLQSEDDDSLDTAVQSERLLEAATDKLSKQLRALEGLALKVVAVQPLSAASRHTEVFPPLPHPLAGGVPPADPGAALAPGSRVPRVLPAQDLLLQLENSGRWPAQPEPFRKMKAALGLQLAQTLHDSCGLTAQASEECVEVLFEGFAFRLQLYSGRDEAMLVERANAVQPSNAQLGILPPAADKAVSPETQPLIRSWHHGLISRVGGANPSYGPACRLAKRWVASQGLSNHIAPEAVELLVAAVYTHPGPRGPPASRTSGLLRFLQLLAQHPWLARPLVVDPDASFTPASHSSLQARFSARRSQPGGSLPALYIITPRDPSSSHWMREHPDPAVLSHMVSLARSCLAAACQLLDGSAQPLAGLSSPAESPADGTQQAEMVVDEEAAHRQQAQHEAALQGALFAAPLQQYDLLLQLRGEALPCSAQGLPGWLSGAGSAVGSGSKRHGRQPDSLSAVLEEQQDRDVPPPKRARAFLDAFPDKAVQGRGPAALRQELLVGFDPLRPLVASLQQQLLGGACAWATPTSHGPATHQHEQQQGQASQGAATHALPMLATLGVDALGGRLLGVKWAPAAFLPAPPKAHTCHTSMPCMLTGLTAANPEGGAAVSGCVPDVARLISEACELGQGIVQGAGLVRGCHNLPVGGHVA